MRACRGNFALIGYMLPALLPHHALTSDNGHYGAYSLARRNESRTWCGVEKGAVTKNGGYPYTHSVKEKRTFNTDKCKPDRGLALLEKRGESPVLLDLGGD
jgi:hypothetical protein